MYIYGVQHELPCYECDTCNHSTKLLHVLPQPSSITHYTMYNNIGRKKLRTGSDLGDTTIQQVAKWRCKYKYSYRIPVELY